MRNSIHKLEAAVEQAMDAFWQVVGERYPAAETGDLSPLADLAFDEAARHAVAEWVVNNVPTNDKPGAKDRHQPPSAQRYRVHYRELGYYQSAVDAESAVEAVRLVRECPPELTFIASEERDVFGIDELRADRTWQPLPESVIDDA